jgi:hypothetical protein
MTAPPALFDLAINRAAGTLHGLGLDDVGSPQAAAALSQWHARTRFAGRIPLAEVMRCLKSLPRLADRTGVGGKGSWHWVGGLEGSWQAGRGAFP